MAARIERDGIAALGEIYLAGPARQQLLAKDPRGYAEFKRQFIEGASVGRAPPSLQQQIRVHFLGYVLVKRVPSAGSGWSRSCSTSARTSKCIGTLIQSLVIPKPHQAGAASAR